MSMPGPEVSVILPTFNRADTLMRAVGSVVGQTFKDWELLIVDDGSTDATPQIDFGFDSRIRVIRQANGGVSAARNKGLAESRGRYLAFLDSDDSWLPHFLEICVGFLKASPEDQFVVTEFLGDDVEDRKLKNAILYTYLRAARRIGSHALDLPPGETDDYLRVWSSRQPIGSWGRAFLADGQADEDHLYQGDIFRHTRWGYLAWLPATVLTREALRVVGGFDPDVRTAEDYPFLARLSKHFRSNMISIPSACKHESGVDTAAPAEGHLATGANAYRFRINRLRYFDELHWRPNRDDLELNLVRREYLYRTAALAMRNGMRRAAVRHFAEAAYPRRPLWRAYALRALAFVLPGWLAAASHRYWEPFI